MRPLLPLLVLLAAATAVAASPSPAGPIGTISDADAGALASADAAAATLGKTLRERLTTVVAQGGPPAGVAVCAAEAQAMTARIAEETGVKVGRSSLRLRNPDNAAPEWVAAWLEEQGERKAEGVVGLARVDRTPGGRVARVIRPIAVEAGCVACHGAKEQIHPEVAPVLAQSYPGDKAVGYAPGDLRGALWAEVAVK